MSTMFVAATGGHLKQLHLLADDLKTRFPGPYHWVTFDREQSRSLLAQQHDGTVDFVPFIGSRDPVNTLRGLRAAGRLIAKHRPTTIVSTGSAIALPYLTIGRRRGIRCIYVESAARSEGPSLTGRMIERLPGIELRTQYPSWADERWSYTGSVFDTFATTPAEPQPVRRVLVTLGTLEYDFSRLVERVNAVVPEDAEVVWQVGGTSPPRSGDDVREFMPEQDLDQAMRHADVVVAHAGVGSALAALEAGKTPILVPRRAEHGEHVDDHQEQIAAELDRRGLAVQVEADDLRFDDLVRGAEGRVARRRNSQRAVPGLRQAA